VSIGTENTAQLRVGPGTNRGAISFLPANTDVTVTGRIELDDGSVWYQLDKAEAAPRGTAAAELWVNAEDVNANGDCERVGDTAAPPVIPMAVAPPPAATTAPGENPPPQADPGTASGDLPAEGGWIINIAGTTNASCEGGPNMPIPSSNSFNGSFTYEDGSNAQVYLNLISPTSMNGQIVGNAIFDGVPCSATVTFVTTHG
jgi:hypothetical protein